jgi:hypothetical protein
MKHPCIGRGAKLEFKCLLEFYSEQTNRRLFRRDFLAFATGCEAAIVFAFTNGATALTINDRAASFGFHLPAKTGHFAALGRAAADLQVHIRLRWGRGWCRRVALSQEMQTIRKLSFGTDSMFRADNADTMSCLALQQLHHARGPGTADRVGPRGRTLGNNAENIHHPLQPDENH